MNSIKRLIPFLLLVAVLAACSAEETPFNYGPELGSGIEFPDDADIQLYWGSADSGTPLKTEWTEDERAQLKEMLPRCRS